MNEGEEAEDGQKKRKGNAESIRNRGHQLNSIRSVETTSKRSSAVLIRP